MHQNPSSALNTLKATLLTLERIQSLLDSESQNLPQDKYSQITSYLKILNDQLKEEIKKSSFNRLDEAPNLTVDDDKSVSNNPNYWWRNLLSKLPK